MKYIALQDKNVGYIQWIGKGETVIEVCDEFAAEMGGDTAKDGRDLTAGEKVMRDCEITHLTKEQYDFLEPFAGDDPEAISFIDSINNWYEKPVDR